jgi:histidinol-phosphatase (PHP family)
MVAIESGLLELGITDHFDSHPLDPCTDHLDLEGWWNSFVMCREKFAGQLLLRAGIEVSEPHRYPERVAKLISNYPWDYILGSLHWVDDYCIFEAAYFEQDPEDAYQGYFDELYRLVDQADFDILAHADAVKRYGIEYYGDFRPKAYEDSIRRILRRLAERNLALEINTSTLRRSIDAPSPGATILQWFREEGGIYVTLGSDAHRPEEVSFRLRQMAKLVYDSGFRGVAQAELRKLILTPAFP